MRIKEFFKDIELECKCGCGCKPSEAAIQNLYALRLLFAEPIRITSGRRCPSYNEQIGGKPNSKHVAGTAFDCKVKKEDELRFITLAYMCGFQGVGFKDNVFIHIDTRQTDAMWGY